MPEQKSLQLALSALARRELSVAELIERLERAGVDAEGCQELVTELAEAGYVSDQRAAAERARVLAERGNSDAAIRADLARRGIGADIADEALQGLGPEHLRAEALARRFGDGRRFALVLRRRGFSQETIEAVAGAGVAEGP